MWHYMWCITKKIVKQTGLLNLCLVLILICLWLYWLWSRRGLYRFALTFPGIFGIPLLGSFNRIRGIKYMIPEFGKMFMERKNYTICIWMGLYPVLLTADPEIVEKILISPELLNKAKTLYQPLQNAFEGGLVGSPAERWHHNRKLINPSFNHSVLVSFIPIFHKAKNIALSKLEALVDGNEHNIAGILARISLGISVETTMGQTMKNDDIIDEDLCSKYAFMMEKITVKILLSCLNLQRSFALYRRFTKTKKYLHNFVNELIKTKMMRSSAECVNNNHNNNNNCNNGRNNNHSNNNNNNYNYNHNNTNNNNETSQEKRRTISEEDVVSMKKTPNIFIDQAIALYHKQQITWQDIIAESNTIVSAAFETTATTTFSVIVMLAMHSEIQERLFVEILDNFPNKDFEMTYEDFKRLPYLDRVINETLRLLPSVPLIGRQTVKDTQLTEQLNLPKDLQILISIFHLHRRTDIWGPNALKFDPDHFLPENLRDKHSHAFIPFSKGIRNCIGWRYALMAMKTMLTGLVRNFRFTTNFKFEDLRYLETVTLRYLVEPRIEIQRR